MRDAAVPGLVQRLLAHEAEQSLNQQNEQQEGVEAVHRVCEKLRVHLSTRIGRDGFRTLLARALKLATAQFPDLNTVRVAPDGTIEGLREAGNKDASSKPGVAAEGVVTILTHLLELLVAFIGDDLTRRILSTIWPLTTPSEENETADAGKEKQGGDVGREVETQ